MSVARLPLLAAVGLALVIPACASGSHPSTEPPAEATRWESRLEVDHPLVGVIWDVAAHRRSTSASFTRACDRRTSCS
jgi:hypothetical protein